MLLEMERKSPNDEMVLALLNQSAAAVMEYVVAERAALKLRRLKPRSADVLKMLATAHAANDRPALTLRTLEEIAERFPGEDTPEGRQLRDHVRDVVSGLLEEFGWRYPENSDLLLLHEESQILLGQGDYAAAGRVMRTLRLRYPTFLPVVNNMALALAAEAEYEKAIVAASEALEMEPDNIHALANLITFHCLLGRRDEAAPYVERIKASKAIASLRRQKMAEALSHFGDHEAVLSIQKQEPSPDETPEITAKVLHYAAAAAYHVDRRATARRFWRQALELTSSEPLYDENLEDLDLPVGERHGPVLYTIPQLIPFTLLTDLMHAGRDVETASPDQEAAIFRKLVRTCPKVVPFTPVVFANCDEDAVGTFFVIARLSADPAMLAAVKDFALGKRGSDKLRMEALSIVREADPGDSGRARMWMAGEWRDIDLLGYEITDEPTPENIDPKAQELLERATGKYHEGKQEDAERIFREAMILAPQSHSIRNNLAAVLMAQGRLTEGRAMIEEIHRNAPNYFFGRCNLASMRARAGDIAGAKALMEPILPLRKLHVTEFMALCGAQIDIAIQEDDVVSAESWLDMLENVNPDHPFLKYRETLQQQKLMKSLQDVMSLPKRGRRKKSS